LAEGGTVGGICGGYQLLGQRICDPHHVESHQENVEGLGLLPVETTFVSPKIVRQVSGHHVGSGHHLAGYQVRMGRTIVPPQAQPFLELMGERIEQDRDGISIQDGRVFGTYLHGLFDQVPFRRWWLNRLRATKGWAGLPETEGVTLDTRLERLADFVELHLSMSMMDQLLEEGV